MAEEGYLPEDLPTEQETYDADAYFVVKKTTMSQARKMLLGTAVPKPNTLDAISAGFNRDSVIMTVDDGAGNLYKITPNQIYEEISELGTLPVFSASDFLRLADVTDSNTEKKYTVSSLLTGMVAESVFTTAVDGRFGNATFNSEVTDNFGNSTFNTAVTALFGTSAFTNAVDAEIDAAYVEAIIDETYIISTIQDESVHNQNLIKSGVIYASLEARKIGDVVTVTVVGINTTGASALLVDYSLPWSPADSPYPVIIGQQNFNFITIGAAGEIYVKITNTYVNGPTGSFVTN